ncbi:MAG TPA: 16S rRNA (adenine(1518)-N(6)/adenine(1519)-N(6))-dimethyltransferase RsmA [Thermoplasmata archaeon]|nr:16S rRNA (adenine(1518)-N(6)/adenine(1519)-N(6))-dimethyltransferase RsmA [Thermoplasmata archaeon]
MSRTSTASSSRRSATEEGTVPWVPEHPQEVRDTLASLGVRPSKEWGQSFLTDPFVADAEAALVELPPGQPVVEVGGGLGVLTAALLRRGIGPITVVEKDRRLAGFLASAFGSRVRVVTGDALTVVLPPASAVVGNLPYSVATPILLRLFAARVPRVVFLVQREVAERLAAAPGSRRYGRLSIIAQLYGSVELFRVVGPEAFSPRPEVESRIGVHVARSGALPVPSVPEFEEMLRGLFSSRRKQLANLLPRVVSKGTDLESAAQRAGWPDDWGHRRPEDLPPEAFFALARILSSGGVPAA